MSQRLTRWALWSAMIIVAVMLGVDILYFAHGSLEEFPTEEQHDKVRRVTAMAAVVLVVAQLGLRRLLTRM